MHEYFNNNVYLKISHDHLKLEEKRILFIIVRIFIVDCLTALFDSWDEYNCWITEFIQQVAPAFLNPTKSQAARPSKYRWFKLDSNYNLIIQRANFFFSIWL